MAATCLQTLQNLRRTIALLILCNAVVVATGAYLIHAALPSCEDLTLLPFLVVSLVAGVRIAATIQTGITQEALAKIILESPPNGPVVDTVARIQKRTMYKKWLGWSRFTMIITVLQFMGAIFLVSHVARYKTQEATSRGCLLEANATTDGWKQNILVMFMIMVCVVALGQCFAGSEVFKWRSFYATEHNAWKAHYQEVFDQGIREAMCCLGRVKYLSALEGDEVHSVAQLLGDLVAYRASGTGHLELLAGLALIENHSQSPISYEGFQEAPQDKIQEAIIFHKFAEAAYTGPLLDVGRNPFIFPCAWLYRQGVLTPWTRKRRPKLDGDNWWRGHAAAFLKYVQLSPETLRQGRVCQTRCEAAYFIVVLHHLRTIVVAVRGTESPEDLITDTLCKECALSEEDLDGLINNRHIRIEVEQSVKSSFPHYSHSGIVEAARDLFAQVEGNPRDDDLEPSGFLSSLLGPGRECEGYMLRIVGHSLGGAIASMLGLRLYRRFPSLHVHAFGPLPCMDFVVANACSEFITSIVYNDEFSSRLSVGSILRLRAASITALAKDAETNSAVAFRLARRFLYMNKFNGRDPEFHSEDKAREDQDNHICDQQYRNSGQGGKVVDQESSLWNNVDAHSNNEKSDDDEVVNPFQNNSHDSTTCDNPVSKFMETVPSAENQSVEDPPEVFLPGFLIHIVPLDRSFQFPLWKGWRRYNDNAESYRAYVADRESFKDIVVSRTMFIDHLPWRSHYVLEKVLEAQTTRHQFDGSQMV